jgi:hypothetical protein
MPEGYQRAAFSVEIARQFSNLPSLGRAWRANVSISIGF